MLSRKVFTSIALLVALCCVAVAEEKKVGLEDIEEDNLRSEIEKEFLNKDDYLQPPGIDAEQSANYGPSDGSEGQYAVEENTAQESPVVAYPSQDQNYQEAGAKYEEIKREPNSSEQPQQDSYAAAYQQHTRALGQNPQQPSVGGYLPEAGMQIVYVPQYDPSASNSISMYANHYQPNVEGLQYYYQSGAQEAQTQYVQQSEEKYQTNEQQDKTVFPEPNQAESFDPQMGFITISADAAQYLALTQGQQYVVGPQYQQQNLAVESKANTSPLHQNYEGLAQQYAYTQQIPQEQPHNVQEYKYVTPATQVQSVSPQFQGPNGQSHQLIPPPIAIHSSPTGQTGHIPRVLSQYAQGVSQPVYSHISGKLVQDNAKPVYETNNLGSGPFQEEYSGSRPNHGDYKTAYEYFPARKPTSLLDSYIPSSVQIEYLKRGLSKEPLSTYDTVAFSRRFPAKFERGFLPNQMYPTASGGVTFGHFNRANKGGGN